MNAELPPTAQVVAEVIGRDATLTLARCVKFRSLFVPKNLPPRHWLRDVIGDQAAERLSNEFPSMQLPLARCANVYRADRDRRILEMRANGIEPRRIAAQLNMPESTVRTVIYRKQRAH